MYSYYTVFEYIIKYIYTIDIEHSEYTKAGICLTSFDKLYSILYNYIKDKLL